MKRSEINRYLNHGRVCKSPFQHILRCGHCDGPMGATYTVKANRHYSYYLCMKDHKRAKSICPVKRVPTGDLEKAVLDQLGAVFRTPTMVADVYFRIKKQEEEEHPNWLIDNGGDSFLYDFGNTDALEAIFQTLKTLIKEEGIDVYREDFNFDTLSYWENADALDRIGVTEMKHIDGHYRLWEMLRQEFPDMPIDACASGGRRLDYLTLSYSWPLCQSDYACFLESQCEYVQVENFYLDEWLPMHTGFTWMPEHKPYDFFSCAGTGVSNKIWQYASRVIPPNHDWDWHRSMLKHNKRMRDLAVNGDYYPLTEKPEDLNRWCAIQMHDSQRNAGYILAFRREKSPECKMTFSIQGVNAEVSYILNWMNGKSQKFTGAELRTGLEIIMDSPRSVTLIYYEKC